MEKRYIVYKHITPDGKSYIGATSTSTQRRWQGGTNYKTSYRFNEAIQKYGWENIRHEVLCEGLTKEEAEQKEIEYIALLKSNDPQYGYNIESGGNSAGKTAEATKARMSESRKGKYYGNHRKHTEEEKRVISEKLKGRPSPMKGRHQSEKMKIERGTPIICITTGARFYGIRDAARQTGCDRSNIARVLKGIKSQTKGLKFEYDREQRLPVC